MASNLLKEGISVEGTTFLRQSSPKNKELFNYCFFVSIRVESQLHKVIASECLRHPDLTYLFCIIQLKTLNVLQKLRGSKLPGYVSLFERSGEIVINTWCVLLIMRLLT